MDVLRFKPSIAPIKKVEGIQFGVLSPDYIRRTSVTQAIPDVNTGKMLEAGLFETQNIYNQQTKKPSLGAVYDPRMGDTTDLESPGYFGHIELAKPVYHHEFLHIVVDILRCVSFYTSRILLTPKQLKNITGKGKRRLKEILAQLKGKTKCIDTGRLQPKYDKDGLKIVIEHFDIEHMDITTPKKTLSAEQAILILEKISNKDVELLGLNPKFCRPEWLIISVIAVPPPHVRPSVSMSSNQKCDDDLTSKLNSIIKANVSLKTAMSKKCEDTSRLEVYLQYQVATFMNNQIPNQPQDQQRSGKPLKTIRERLTGKEGRVRGNLMGKRVDFSARTVATADPNLEIEQIGVPISIAKNLTIPDRVTPFNIKQLQHLVDNGPDIHPGAKYVIKSNGKKVDLRFAGAVLEVGWTVERHMDDNDIVLVNRQPSLHKMSMMGHRVKVLPFNTFRLNLAITKSYNLDFDGDEVNVHFPQTLTARTEIEELMMAGRLLVSPQANRPVNGIIQDSLLASAKMTRRDVFMDREHVFNALMHIDYKGVIPEPAVFLNVTRARAYASKVGKSTNEEGTCIIQEVDEHTDDEECIEDDNSSLESMEEPLCEIYPMWTGKQIYSLIIPKEINLIRKSNESIHEPEGDDEYMTTLDTRVLIERGEIISGTIDVITVGIKAGGLTHIMFLDLGHKVAKRFLFQVQKLTNYWIMKDSFTIGISDTIVDVNTGILIGDILRNVKEDVKELARNKDGLTPVQLEGLINAKLNSARDDSGRLSQQKLTFANNIKQTVSAGSKGSVLNVSQIMACVGQQNVEGARIKYGFNYRTLPHYGYNDIEQESRGFIENSYITGLTPQEFFFHAQAGREGLIDTACKSITGDNYVFIFNSRDHSIIRVQIGEWIDGLMNKSNPIKYNDFLDMELLNILTPISEGDVLTTEGCDQYYIPTADLNGNTSWGKITAVTRHNPGDYVYEVTTKSGRAVRVVESETLLIWDVEMGDFVPTLTSQVKIGDCVPTIASMHQPPSPPSSPLHTYTNGVFIGIIIAMDALITSQDITILFPDTHINVRNFVLNWLFTHNITYTTSYPDTKTLSIMIRSSMLLSLVGDDTLTKAYVACEQYVSGILSGYGICTIGELGKCTKYNEGIASLLNRVGIVVSNADTPLVSVDTSSERVSDESDMKRVNGMHIDTGVRSADVLLDPIISIKPLVASNYNKVYDMTIPSTLNFAIANGIVVYDTSSTGYIQRRLVKALEDAKVQYDGTVRDNKGNIIQLIYGDDGIDATYIETQQIDLVGYDSVSFDRVYKHALTSTIDMDNEYAQLKEDQQTLFAINLQRNFTKGADKTFNIPVNINRILWNSKYVFVECKEYYTINQLISKFRMLLDRIKPINSGLIHRADNATKLFKIHIRSATASKCLTIPYRYNKFQIDYIIEIIESKYFAAIIAPGEMVGVVAAQSVGEPITQMTLNTFHHTGIAGKNVTLGVPRFSEIINVSKTLKTPYVTIFLNGETSVEQLKSMLEYRVLKNFILMSKISTLPHPIIDRYSIFSPVTEELVDKYYLQLELNSDILEHHHISVHDILRSLYDTGDSIKLDRFRLYVNDDNDTKPTIIIKLASTDADLKEFQVIEILSQFEIVLNKVKLGGIFGITRTFVEEKSVDTWRQPEQPGRPGQPGEPVSIQPGVLPTSGVSADGWSKVKKTIIDTEGTNLREILNLRGVDYTKTISNDILEIYNIFGIEAARGALFNELRNVISFDGSYINYRHIAILSEIMTYKGFIMSITRHGINRSETTGALMKCSFEETVDVLTESAAFSQLDIITGVSENIMLGQFSSIGTGAFEIMMNEQALTPTPSSVVPIVPVDDHVGSLAAAPAVRQRPTPLVKPVIERMVKERYVPSSPT